MNPTRWFLASLILALGAVPALVACGGGEPSGLSFHGEGDVIPGFSFDTGLQPPSSPVQLQLQVSASGKNTVDGMADQGGPASAPTVVGRAGTGKLAVDGHFKLEGRLKVDVTGIKYDGPIPKLDEVDLRFGGASTFDPFLLGKSVSVKADVPATDLPAIPLPGGVPGTLVLSIEQGSTVTTALEGVCAGVSGGKVQWLGRTGTDGSLKIKARIVLKLPIGGDKTFAVPSVTIPLPTAKHDLDLGTRALDGDGAPVTGPVESTATQGSCGGSPTTTDGGAADGGNPESDASTSAYVKHTDLVWLGTQSFYQADGGAVPQCQLACDVVSGCVAFSTDGTQCGGFSTLETPYHYMGATTYVRSSQAIAKYLAEPGTDHNGSDITSKTGMTPESCAALCDATTGCVGFALSTNPNDGKLCWLKSAWGTASTMSDRLSFCLPTTTGCSGY